MPRWAPGDEIVLRYGPPGRFTGARPLRVVADREDYVAAWLPPGTTVMEPVVGPDAKRLREIPLEERFHVERRPEPREWRGAGILKLIPRGDPWSIWLFWRETGAFWGWYVNLEQRHRWHAGGADTRDNVLDVMVHADRSWEWKDEDELVEAVRQGFRSEAEAEAIRADGRRAVELVERWAAPFTDGWERWRPDPAWPLPELQPDWDEG